MFTNVRFTCRTPPMGTRTLNIKQYKPTHKTVHHTHIVVSCEGIFFGREMEEKNRMHTKKIIPHHAQQT